MYKMFSCCSLPFPRRKSEFGSPPSAWLAFTAPHVTVKFRSAHLRTPGPFLYPGKRSPYFRAKRIASCCWRRPGFNFAVGSDQFDGWLAGHRCPPHSSPVSDSEARPEARLEAETDCGLLWRPKLSPQTRWFPGDVAAGRLEPHHQGRPSQEGSLWRGCHCRPPVTLLCASASPCGGVEAPLGDAGAWLCSRADVGVWTSGRGGSSSRTPGPARPGSSTGLQVTKARARRSELAFLLVLGWSQQPRPAVGSRSGPLPLPRPRRGQWPRTPFPPAPCRPGFSSGPVPPLICPCRCCCVVPRDDFGGEVRRVTASFPAR